MQVAGAWDALKPYLNAIEENPELAEAVEAKALLKRFALAVQDTEGFDPDLIAASEEFLPKEPVTVVAHLTDEQVLAIASSIRGAYFLRSIACPSPATMFCFPSCAASRETWTRGASYARSIMRCLRVRAARARAPLHHAAEVVGGGRRRRRIFVVITAVGHKVKNQKPNAKRYTWF